MVESNYSGFIGPLQCYLFVGVCGTEVLEVTPNCGHILLSVDSGHHLEIMLTHLL